MHTYEGVLTDGCGLMFRFWLYMLFVVCNWHFDGTNFLRANILFLLHSRQCLVLNKTQSTDTSE